MKKILSSFLAFCLFFIAFVSPCLAGSKDKIFFIPTPSFSYDDPGKHVRGKGFSVEDEKLIGEVVKDVAVDSDGYAWIGTIGGLSRFDAGKRDFINYNKTNGLGGYNVSTVTLDDEGTIWIGVEETIAKAETSTDEDGNKDIDVENLGNFEFFKDIRVNSVYEDWKGRLWMSTNKGIYIRSEGRWDFYVGGSKLPFTVPKHVTLDKDKNLWVAADTLYYYPLGGGDPKHIWLDSWLTYLPFGETTMDITALAADDENNLWIGTKEEGLYKYDIDQSKWTTVGTPNLPSNQVRDLVWDDRKNELWVATDRGVARLRSGSFWQIFNEDGGLVNNKVNSITVTADEVWFGTNDGASRFTETRWLNVKRGKVTTKEVSLSVSQEQALEEEEAYREGAEREEEEARVREMEDNRGGIFRDIKSEAIWAIDYIFALFDRGIFKSNESFYPNRTLTNAEALKIALEAAEMEISESFDQPTFVDVPLSHWVTPYLAKALEEDVIDSGRLFRPGQSISRFEALEMLLKAFSVHMIAKSTTDFEDITAEQLSWIETAVEKGIVKGYDESTYVETTVGNQYPLAGKPINAFGKGENVKLLQKALRDLGFYNGPIDGNYGYPLVNAVADYQIDRGIVRRGEDGLGGYGHKTRSTLLGEKVSSGVKGGVKKLFKPDDSLTRAQMAKIVFKLINLE